MSVQSDAADGIGQEREDRAAARGADPEFVGDPLHALLYVSRVAIDPDRLAWTLADIQTVSVARNTAFDITGLLIATPSYFAQYMEGPRGSLATIMDCIQRDPRHCEIRVIRDGPLARRIGGFWRLVRVEPGSFEARHVTPLLARAHQQPDEAGVAALMGLIRRLSARRGETPSPAGEPARADHP
jgi:hypothetical protein